MFKLELIDQAQLQNLNLDEFLWSKATQTFLSQYLEADAHKIETSTASLLTSNKSKLESLWQEHSCDRNVLVRNFLGQTDWTVSFEQMVDFTKHRTAGTLDQILLLEHLPVFTQGLTADRERNILGHDDHIPIVQADRGGQVTYHGPQQLIVYLLIDFNRKKHFFEEFDLKFYARNIVSAMEDAVVNVLTHLGIPNVHARPDAPGIYVDLKKVSSLGLKVTKNGTYHGIAINLDMDLTPFHLINPCGYAGLEMCNVSDYVNLETFKKLGINLDDYKLPSIVPEELANSSEAEQLTIYRVLRAFVGEYFVSYLAQVLGYGQILDGDRLLKQISEK